MFSIVEYLSTSAIHLIEMLGYWGVFLGMTIESACIPLPSEIIMPFAGFVVWEGQMTLWGITLAGALGNLFGSLIAYYVGWKGGRPLLEKYGKYILISHSKLQLADEWFEKYGDKAVLISRVLPGVRTFISLPAGIAHMDLKKFVTYTFVGSLPWCFALGYAGVLLGPNWTTIQAYGHVLDVVVAIGVIVFLAYLIYHYRGKNHLDE
ncbi:MAG TPA: DedA family protein [Methanobacteriaceae archaeon]|nr:DedA family protein [Methanobacteriaceae archaeon]